MKKIKLLLVMIVFAATYLSLGSYANADDNFRGFSTSSMIMNTKAKQGESFSTTFTLFNDTAEDVKATLAIKDFEKKGNQLVYKDDVPKSFSVRQWTTVNKEAVIPANGSKEIKLDITVPKDAEIGEHSALVSALFAPTGEGSGKSNVKMSTEILPVLYVVVTDETGTINLDKKWTFGGVTHSSINPHSIQFSVSNEGNVHVESSGKITAKSATGKTYQVEIPGVNLLPKNSKDIVVDWDPPSSFDIYSVSYEFTMDGKDIKTGSFKVYMINWTYVLYGFLALLLIIVLPTILIIRSRKKYKKLEARIAAMSKSMDQAE